MSASPSGMNCWVGVPVSWFMARVDSMPPRRRAKGGSTPLANGALLTLYGRAVWAHDFGNTPAASAIFQTRRARASCSTARRGARRRAGHRRRAAPADERLVVPRQVRRRALLDHVDTAAPAWRRKRGKRLVARSPESKRGVLLKVTFGQHRRKIDRPAR